MFKNLRLSVKLNGAFVAVACLTLLLGSAAVISMWKVHKVRATSQLRASNQVAYST